MIYIFDKKQAIIKVLTNDDFTAAHLNFKINTATTFEFSLPASKALPSGSKYVATPHPLNDSKFIMLRLTERVDKTETIDYSAYELAYQELATDGYIEDKRPHNQSALNLMKIALDGSNWELNNVNVSGTATTNFYYVDRLSAISKVVDLLGGEIVFYIEIQGNAISGRYMDYLARQGADTSKVFSSGSNLLTVERQSDTSGIYTAILPRGKGEEIDNGKADTPDGYGRRINIADVEWKKSAGKPLDKPKGSIVLSDPDATAEWGQINGNARLLLKTYDDIDDVNVLINSAYKTLQSVNHPQIQYSATVADVGGLSLGDTVLIMHGDRDLSYKTRVFEVKYDLLSPDQTELSLGDDLSSNSITSQINSLNAVADTTSSQTQWTINQIGRPSTTFGNAEPANPKVGDVFFKELPDGGTEIHRWNGNIWELLASPTTADDIAKAVNDAVTQAKSHVDEVKQVLSSDIETAKSQAASLANAAEANAKSEAVSQFNRAQSILSDAKKDLTKSIEHEASERNDAVADANSKAQKYVDEAKKDINDTINAFSVGGRNLLLGTKDFSSNSNWAINGDLIDDVYQGLSAIQTSMAWGGPKYNISALESQGVIQSVDDTFVMSSWVRNTGTSPTAIYFYGDYLSLQNYKVIDLPAKSGWIRINSQPFRFTKTSGLNGIMRFEPITNPTSGYVQQVGLKLEKGNIATDWTPAPEDVVLDYTTKDNKIKETITQYKETNDGHVSKLQTTAQTAVDGLKTKVSQTVYDQKTGELLHNINEAKDTADKSLRTISDIQEADGKRDSRISEVEKTAGEIKSTVSDLSTAQDKQSGSISTLQQRAEGFEATVTKVDNLAVGGRNLYLNSKWLADGYGVNGNTKVTVEPFDSTTNMWHIVAAQGNGDYIGIFFGQDGNVSNLITKGQQWAFSFDIKGTGVYRPYGFGVEGSSPYNGPSGNVPTEWTRVSSTGTATGTNSIIIYFNASDSPLDAYIKLPKLETGTIATDWTPAPEDISSTISKVKLTADEASAAVSKLTSSDGIITKVQADIKVNADAITKMVSKEVYDQKTGEISEKINKAKDTADESLQTIGDYKTSNDKRVHDAESSIERTANAITEKVSRTDYDKKTGELTHDLSELKHTADGFEATVTKVNNLAVGGRNLLLGTRDWTDNTRWNQRGTVTKDVYRGMVIASTGGAWSSPVYMMQNAGILQVGKTYTFSTYVRNTSDTDTNVAPYYEDGVVTPVYTPTSLPAHTDWFRVSITFQCVKDPTTSTSGLRWEGQNGLTNGQIQFAGYKLEEGTIATDWSPAPEDVQFDIAQVKVTADSISNFVRDPSGNISSDFQTALSKTSIITGSTLASSIQKQTSSQISSAIKDNNGKIISLINQDSSGVQIAGKNIILDGDTTVTGTFKVSQANIANGSIGTAQIGDASITSAKIISLDVARLTGNVSNFIQSNWNGVYGSTYITADGMSVSSGTVTTSFGSQGMRITMASNGGVVIQGTTKSNGTQTGVLIGMNVGSTFTSFGFQSSSNYLYNDEMVILKTGSAAAGDYNIGGGVAFNHNVSFMDNIYMKYGKGFYGKWGDSQQAIFFQTINGGIPAIMHISGAGIAFGHGGDLYMLSHGGYQDFNNSSIKGSYTVDQPWITG